MSDDMLRSAIERVLVRYGDAFHEAHRWFQNDERDPEDGRTPGERLIEDIIAEADIELLQRDSVRWNYVRTEFVRAYGVHMDGTSEYAMVGRLPRAKTVEEAVDQKIREVIDEAR